MYFIARAVYSIHAPPPVFRILGAVQTRAGSRPGGHAAAAAAREASGAAQRGGPCESELEGRGGDGRRALGVA